MPRKPHPDKDIEAAIKHAESAGWRIEKASGHAWGKMYCPSNAKCRCGNFCVSSIWSTPRSAHNEARKIRRAVDNCTKPKTETE